MPALTISCYPIDSGDSTKTCGGKEYDTSEFSCEGGELVGKCKGVDYYPDYQTCNKGTIEDKPSGGSSSGKAGSSSSGKAGGISFNENSQIYYKEDGTAYKGSGVIEMVGFHLCFSWGDEESECNWSDGVKIGNVTKGIVSLNLPANIPDSLFMEFFSDEEQIKYCSNYPKGIKMFPAIIFGDIILTDNDGGYRSLSMSNDSEGLVYLYFSKAGKITCSAPFFDILTNYDINAKEGWNKIYMRGVNDDKSIELTTDNILTKEVKWQIGDLMTREKTR